LSGALGLGEDAGEVDAGADDGGEDGGDGDGDGDDAGEDPVENVSVMLSLCYRSLMPDLPSRPAGKDVGRG
jgi:hypothetical protein